MQRLLYIVKVMQGFPETIITFFVIMTCGDVKEGLAITILFFTAFYWALQLKRIIQQQYFNSPWRAIRSLFKKVNKYGENPEE